jgi:hypothetical protein
MAYKRMIAPFKKDMPISELDGYRRVCSDHKYAYIGSDIFINYYSAKLSCRLMPLHGTSFRAPVAFIIPDNSYFKGLINWR